MLLELALQRRTLTTSSEKNWDNTKENLFKNNLLCTPARPYCEYLEVRDWPASYKCHFQPTQQHFGLYPSSYQPHRKHSKLISVELERHSRWLKEIWQLKDYRTMWLSGINVALAFGATWTSMNVRLLYANAQVPTVSAETGFADS
jgi:hypothetical protein